jgi:3-methyladenine DNA glycosylase Mpg
VQSSDALILQRVQVFNAEQHLQQEWQQQTRLSDGCQGPGDTTQCAHIRQRNNQQQPLQTKEERAIEKHYSPYRCVVGESH